MLSQEEAVQIIDDGQKRVADLIAQLPDAALAEKGIGADGWTVQDLIGHLTFWENAASEALDAWALGGVAPIDRALRRGLNNVNADALRQIREATLDAVRQRADQAHSALLISILEMGPDLWGSLPTARHLQPIGDVLGRILGGPEGPYSHASGHVEDLEAFVTRVTRPAS